MKTIEKEFSKLFLKIYFFIFLISFLGLALKNSRTFFVIFFSFFIFFDILKILKFKHVYRSSRFLLTYISVLLFICFHMLIFPELNSIFLLRIRRFIFVCMTIYLIAQEMTISHILI